MIDYGVGERIVLRGLQGLIEDQMLSRTTKRNDPVWLEDFLEAKYMAHQVYAYHRGWL